MEQLVQNLMNSSPSLSKPCILISGVQGHSWAAAALCLPPINSCFFPRGRQEMLDTQSPEHSPDGLRRPWALEARGGAAPGTPQPCPGPLVIRGGSSGREPSLNSQRLREKLPEVTGKPSPVFLLGESPWTEEPGGLWSMGSQRVGLPG